MLAYFLRNEVHLHLGECEGHACILIYTVLKITLVAAIMILLLLRIYDWFYKSDVNSWPRMKCWNLYSKMESENDNGDNLMKRGV